jgi:hypothetical protein
MPALRVNSRGQLRFEISATTKEFFFRRIGSHLKFRIYMVFYTDMQRASNNYMLS